MQKQYYWLMSIAMLAVLSAVAEETNSVIVEKSVNVGSEAVVFRVTSQPSVQVVSVGERTITNNGTLIDLQRVSAKVDSGSPAIIWRRFFVLSPGPSPRWGADIASGSAATNLFLLLTTGTAFSIYEVDVNGVPEQVPQQVKGSSIQLPSITLNSPHTIHPPTEFFSGDPFTERASLRRDGDDLVVSFGVRTNKVQDFHYSVREQKWK